MRETLQAVAEYWWAALLLTLCYGLAVTATAGALSTIIGAARGKRRKEAASDFVDVEHQ